MVTKEDKHFQSLEQSLEKINHNTTEMSAAIAGIRDDFKELKEQLLKYLFYFAVMLGGIAAAVGAKFTLGL